MSPPPTQGLRLTCRYGWQNGSCHQELGPRLLSAYLLGPPRCGGREGNPSCRGRKSGATHLPAFQTHTGSLDRHTRTWRLEPACQPFYLTRWWTKGLRMLRQCVFESGVSQETRKT